MFSFPNYMGNMSFYSKYKSLKGKQKDILKYLIKEGLFSTNTGKGVFVLTDDFEKFQVFDNDIMLHIQNMADQYIFYGEQLLELFDNSLCKENFCKIYKDITLFRDRVQITRDKFFNFVFRVMKNEDNEPILYCQMYYSGDSIYSMAVKKRVTFRLDRFIKFLETNKTVLHMYKDPRNIIDYRKNADKKNYHFGTCDAPPDNLYHKFQNLNSISHDL